MDKTHVFLMLLVIAAVTAALRALPFLIFRSGKQTPEFVSYLGKTLPFAIMGMLVVFCLRNTAVRSAARDRPAGLAAEFHPQHRWRHGLLHGARQLRFPGVNKTSPSF